jgi:RNA polymerase sigma-70 factor (ECF subfamily)
MLDRRPKPCGSPEGTDTQVSVPYDNDLIQRAQRGDAEAFATLVRQHQDTVLRLVGRVLPSREDAEDVVQEAIVAAFRQVRGFRGEAAFGTWLTRIALRMAMRRASRRPGSVPVDDPPRMEAQPSLALVMAEAVGKLPAPLRIPVVLRYYEGLSGAEIAAALGWKQSTVWTRLYRGLQRLRQEWGDDEL